MLQPLQGKALKSFQDATAWINIWHGSVSSGKTVTSFFSWGDFILNGPPGNLLMCGKTERTLRRNVIDPLVEMYGSKNINTTGIGRGEIQIFGRRVYLVGANDERSEQKIRGLSIVGAYCDELSTYPSSFFVMLLSRLRQDGARCYCTTNPEAPRHWLKVDYLDKENLDLKQFHFVLEDNPFLPALYVENLKKTYTGLWYKRYILGLWVLAEGVVFDAFDEEKHVFKGPLDKYEKYFCGVDYGTANPTCFLLFGEKDKKVYCIKEYYYDGRITQRQKTDGEYSKDLKEFIKGYEVTDIIIDPSALSFITQCRADGIRVRAANNAVLDGIRVCSNFLSNGRYLVHESCKNHIKEFYGYVWDEKAQERGEDRPIKDNDHCL